MHPSLRHFLSIIQQLNPFRAGYPSPPFKDPDPDSRVHTRKKSVVLHSNQLKQHKDCEIWAQLMIRLAIQRLQDVQDSNLRTVLFLHSSQQSPSHIECWISSHEEITSCDLETGQLIGLLPEENWDSCWPILVRELERISTNMNAMKSDQCCAIISTPQYPGIAANSSVAKKMVAWRIATLSKPEVKSPAPHLRAVGTNRRAHLRLVRK